MRLGGYDVTNLLLPSWGSAGNRGCGGGGCDIACLPGFFCLFVGLGAYAACCSVGTPKPSKVREQGRLIAVAFIDV